MKKKCGCNKFTCYSLTKKARWNLVKIAKLEKISLTEVINRIVSGL